LRYDDVIILLTTLPEAFQEMVDRNVKAGHEYNMLPNSDKTKY